MKSCVFKFFSYFFEVLKIFCTKDIRVTFMELWQQVFSMWLGTYVEYVFKC